MEQTKLFQALLFNGLFGKLFVGSKASKTPREFILKKDDTFLLWVLIMVFASTGV
jgi:endoribonuclease Dicer